MKARTIRKIGKAALIGAGTLAAVYVGTSVALGFLLVRPSRRRRYDSVPGVRHGRMEAVRLTAADGVRLHAWVLRSRCAAPENWVVLLHGYRSDRTASHRRVKLFARRGYNVLLLHFRGHGSSQRTRISYGYNERLDVRAAFDYLRSLPLGRRARIGVDGRSMGAAAAAYAVGKAEIDPDWMILESCYDRIENAFANRLALKVGRPLAPLMAWPVELVVEQLVRLRAEDLDPAKALEKTRCPVLVLAGDSEKVLKLAEIEYLYGCIPEPKRLVLFPGAAHEDLLAHDPRRYIRAVGAFLRTAGRRGGK
jgi:uncharacterized protein